MQYEASFVTPIITLVILVLQIIALPLHEKRNIQKSYAGQLAYYHKKRRFGPGADKAAEIYPDDILRR